MRKPTEEQIARWTSEAVYHERTRLPYDHPNRLRYGGAALAEVRREGQNGVTRLQNNGIYDAEDIKRRAWGDVDLDKVRRETAEQDERRELSGRLADLAKTAPIEQVRAAVLGLEAVVKS